MENKGDKFSSLISMPATRVLEIARQHGSDAAAEFAEAKGMMHTAAMYRSRALTEKAVREAIFS